MLAMQHSGRSNKSKKGRSSGITSMPDSKISSQERRCYYCYQIVITSLPDAGEDHTV